MKFAVIFAGCGYLDGAEIREAVLTLLELENNDINYDIFAPNIPQHDVINHLNQTETNETRNVLVESARIARGKIKPLSELDQNQYSALVMTGGFGVAKNFSKLAFEGSRSHVIPEIEDLINSFFNNKKPIGAICIAPAIVAITLKDKNPQITLGINSKTLDEIGIKNNSCDSDDIIFDEINLIISTPAYMHEHDPLPKIHKGIGKLIIKLKEITK